MKTASESSKKPTPDSTGTSKADRRSFLKTTARLCAAGALGAGALRLLRPGAQATVWQLDPSRCVQCGRCATECVLAPSAVKCVHAYEVCGYCKLCGGYHRPNTRTLSTAAENQLCPTGAIQRTFIEDPYYEYTIREERCIGCGRCVKNCEAFGNGSLFLQIRHNLCAGCNECAIAVRCPAKAFRKVPLNRPTLRKGRKEPT